MTLNNEVKDFIYKIKVIYDKNSDLHSFINIDELIECLNELDSLIEMYTVKSVIIKHIQTLIVLYLKNKTEKNFDNHMLHTVFYGNPGVGKSKTAKILAKIWKSLNIISNNKKLNNEILLTKINSSRDNFLSLYENYLEPKHKDCKTMWKHNEFLWNNIKSELGNIGDKLVDKIKSDKKNTENHIVIAGREDFVAEYSGQTSIKALNFLNSCKGKCLIIEEAYSLYGGDNDSYGMEALTVLNRFMDENPKDIIVIFTGYEDRLKNTIFKAQPGLKRRCQWLFNLIGYSPEGLANIFIQQLTDNGWIVEDKEKITEFFKSNEKHFENFGGDTDKLTFQCKLVYSDYTMEKMFENMGNYNLDKIIINYQIVEKAFEQYLQHRKI